MVELLFPTTCSQLCVVLSSFFPLCIFISPMCRAAFGSEAVLGLCGSSWYSKRDLFALSHLN